ncbi:MAG: hypothetical protein LBJ67_06765 [Planctomycetaceae bacterium]|nr:hypothetical protein [Planctomycetaceae bacterium]
MSPNNLVIEHSPTTVKVPSVPTHRETCNCKSRCANCLCGLHHDKPHQTQIKPLTEKNETLSHKVKQILMNTLTE